MLKHLFNNSKNNEDASNISNNIPEQDNNIALTHVQTFPIKPEFINNIIHKLNLDYPHRFHTAINEPHSTVRKTFLAFLEESNSFNSTPMHKNHKIAKAVCNELFGIPIIQYLLKYHSNITEIMCNGKYLQYIDNNHIYTYGNQNGEDAKYFTNKIINIIISRLTNHYPINITHPIYDGKYKNWNIHAMSHTLIPNSYGNYFTMTKGNQFIKPLKSHSNIWTNNKFMPLQPTFIQNIINHLQFTHPVLINKMYNINNLGEYFNYSKEIKSIISKSKLVPKQNNKELTNILFTDIFKLGIIHRISKIMPELDTFIIYNNYLLYGTLNTHQAYSIKGKQPVNSINTDLIIKVLTHNHKVDILHPNYSGTYNIWHFNVDYLIDNKKSIIMRRP